MILKEFIFRAGITRKHFAEKIGVSPIYIGWLINGKTECSRKMAKKIEEITKGEVSFKEAMFPEEYEDERLTI